MNNKIIVKNKMLELIKKINHHDNLYYKKNYQEISDDDYDKLRRELLELEKKFPEERLKDSPNKNVGKIDNEKFKTVQHYHPMLSLNNAYNENELKSFYNKISSTLNSKFNVIAETKVDGLSASLRYENRKLKVGLTRGDGAKGEDITRNLDHVEGIQKVLPKTFPENLEIRGEIFMKKKIFEELNKKRKMAGLPLFSTTRNAAAGSVRQLDPEITKKRKLSFYGYTLFGDDQFFGKNLNKIREILIQYNFSLNQPSKLCDSYEEMIKFYNYINSIRSSMEYDIDGIVYKLDSIEDQHKLGETSRWPRWAIAYKFPAESAITTLDSVSFQVGRTGSITPVAILKEVIIGGVKINRATLHNEDEIIRLGVEIGDTISIQRAGDVIPKITSVVKKSLNPIKILFPEYCPSCGSKLNRFDNEAAVRCTNFGNCKEQSILCLAHFVSRNAFDISGLGERQLRLLWKKKIIRSFSDIFLLEKKSNKKEINLDNLEGFGEKSINNLFASINVSKRISFDRFIFSLGIRHVGQGIATILSEKFKNVNNFLEYFTKTKCEEKIEGIGDVIVDSVKSYFEDQKNLSQIKFLLELINIKSRINEKKIFTNKVIVLTGSFKTLSRKNLEKILKEMGAKVSSSVSNKTDFLFCGADPGSKLDKAKKLDIKILDNAEVEKIINN